MFEYNLEKVKLIMNEMEIEKFLSNVYHFDFKNLSVRQPFLSFFVDLCQKVDDRHAFKQIEKFAKSVLSEVLLLRAAKVLQVLKIKF